MKTVSEAHRAYDMGHDWGTKMADVAEVRIGACADEAADAIRAGDKRMRVVDWHPLRKVPREFVADYQRGFDEAVREGAKSIVDGQKMLYRHASIPLCGASGASKPRASAKKVSAKRAPAKKPAKAKRRVAKKAAPKRASAKKTTAKRASVKRPAAKKRAAPKRSTKAKRTTRKASRSR